MSRVLTDLEIEHERNRKARDSQFQNAENIRVSDILGRDRAHWIEESRRDAALAEMADERFVNLDAIPIPPTPEQLAKGEFVSFTADKVEGTVRPMRTVRRVMKIRIEQLNQRGILDDDMFAAAKWYRDHWERSGLEVSIPAVQYGERIVGEQCYGAMARTERQAISRDFYRSANAAISPEFREMFDAVTLMDLTLDEMAKTYHCRLKNLVAAYRAAALEVHGFAAPHLEVRTAFEKRC